MKGYAIWVLGLGLDLGSKVFYQIITKMKYNMYQSLIIIILLLKYLIIIQCKLYMVT